MLHRIKHLLEWINRTAALTGGLLVLVVGGILFAEVALRWSGRPTEWIPEWSVYLFAWAMLGGAAYTLQQGRHVRVELLFMHLSPVWRCRLDMLTCLLGAALCALIAAQGWEHLEDVLLTGETSSTALRVPLWLTDFPLFAGFALLALQFLALAGDRFVASLLAGRFTGGRT